MKKKIIIAASEISGFAEDSHLDRSTLVLYDSDNNDITASYDLSGGGL